MYRFLIVLTSVLAFSACHPPANNAAVDLPKPDSVDKSHYVPVQDLLRSEMSEVDSIPYRIMLYHNRDGKKDSVLLKSGQFDDQAKAFLVPGLDSAAIADRFTESSFFDQTTGMLTFTYATRDSLPGVRRIDILLTPGAGTDKLQSIYLEETVKENDSLKLRKMTWTAGRHFSILELVHPAQGATITRETRVVWNDQ